MSQQTVSVLLFAAARDRAGQSTVDLRLPTPATVADVRSQLITVVPALKPIANSLLIAVDESYASDDTPIPENADIACFPPVSGG